MIYKYISSIIHKPKTKVSISNLILSNKCFSKEFLRGYFSCDGSVSLSINRDGKLLRNVALLSRNTFIFDALRRMLDLFKVPYHSSKGIIGITTKKGISNFYKKIGFLPVIIRKGKNWKYCRKDILLKLAVKSFSEDFKKRFANKESGYKYLRNKYNELLG